MGIALSSSQSTRFLNSFLLRKVRTFLEKFTVTIPIAIS
ncbi:hypothetical protein MJC1_00443 [Methylocystis sp. MJC1]|nr:hypothetical protein MJC1_00443 [Methylocystis sp. MJC1]